MHAILFRTITACVWVSLVCVATTASAQGTDLTALRTEIEPGSRLRITDRAGVVTEGELLGLSPDSLRLIVPPGRLFEIAKPSLARVERVKRATLLGTIAGLLAGAAVGVLVADSSCNRGCSDRTGTSGCSRSPDCSEGLARVSVR